MPPTPPFQEPGAADQPEQPEKPGRTPVEFDPEKHCGAHPDSAKGPCRAWQGQGTDHPGTGRCKWHGGSSPGAKAAARRERAAVLAQVWGVPVDVDPTTAILDQVKLTAGVVAWLDARVRELGEDDIVVEGETRAYRHEYVKLWQDERDRLVDYAAAALKAGVEERRVRLAEAQGQVLVTVIRAILADLNLSHEQEALVGDVVPKHLRLVTGLAAGAAAA